MLIINTCTLRWIQFIYFVPHAPLLFSSDGSGAPFPCLYLSEPAVWQYTFQMISVMDHFTTQFLLQSCRDWEMVWGRNYSVASFLLLFSYARPQSMLLLHLCKEYLTVVKWKTPILFLINYWTFWYLDHSASMKSSTLELWHMNCVSLFLV